ncbi:helix-turn-helix domain-containing protein [Mariprofundus erugo]|uniref:helix-turn-helix transcriptional regulator n=1 Tax=Mariprofundus erugo TaxID=2528639 RepID=UPI0010FDF01B|nr:helix-turn-helix domain-containing protein [Mariprofundus erugo]TLS77918.1 helix-turn-helix domain-containing protein [Mariprofundus erugo]
MDVILTPVDLAERWKVVPKTIYQRISNGDDMPMSLKIGRCRRFRLADVRDWEMSHEEFTHEHNPSRRFSR